MRQEPVRTGRRTPRTLIVSLVIALQVLPAYGQRPDEFGRLRDLWLKGQYAEVIDRLEAYRMNAASRDELLKVDYYIGTSACKVGEIQFGLGYLSWMMARYSYDLVDEMHGKILHEFDNCGVPGHKPSDFDMPNQPVAHGAGVSGGFKVFDELKRGTSTDMEITKVERVLPPREISRRLIPLNIPQQADAAVRQTVSGLPEFKVLVRSPFILVSWSPGHRPDVLESIATGLRTIFGYFQTEYGMRRTQNFITVYLVPDTISYQRVAFHVYGLRLSERSIGYSSPVDLSMVAIIPRGTYGTLRHELFHLTISSSFGDAPPWLEEGMAAYFESAQLQPGGTFRDTDDWRWQILEKALGRNGESFPELLPSLSTLLGMNWRQFSSLQIADPVKRTRSQAVNQATARYFVAYLSCQRKLGQVFRALKDRTPRKVTTSGINVQEAIRRDSEVVLSSLLGRDLDSLQQVFRGWFLAGRECY